MALISYNKMFKFDSIRSSESKIKFLRVLMAEYIRLADQLPRTHDLRGSIDRAFLLAITSGTKTSKSLNFCSQIGTKVYKSQIIFC